MSITELIKQMDSKYEEYLKDESRLVGEAVSISFPQTEQQVTDVVSQLCERGVPITIQGARTGITGAAVPKGGHILNLSKMTAIHGLTVDDDGVFQLEVQPGVLLSELTTRLAQKDFDTTVWSKEAKDAYRRFLGDVPYFFPPTPTEATATVGGMFACNAAGINAYYYGATAEHIMGIRMVLATGETWEVDRGKYVFTSDGCPLPNGKYLALDDVILDHPISRGLVVSPGTDLVDLLAGSEGMLGVITKLRLKLFPDPREKWGIVFFFQDNDGAITFAQSVQEMSSLLEGARIVALELFDRNTLEMIRHLKDKTTRLKTIPDVEKWVAAAIYMELHADEVEMMEAALLQLSKLFSECGGKEDATWAACGNAELEKLRLFRHAAPESVNSRIDELRRSDSRITKLGTDMSAPQRHLSKTLRMYWQGLASYGLYGVVFGHIGSNHLHVNIIPEDYEQYQKGLALVDEWAETLIGMGGMLAAENGVGKLKRDLYLRYASEKQLRMARQIKSFFDPDGLLNPSNMV